MPVAGNDQSQGASVVDQQIDSYRTRVSALRGDTASANKLRPEDSSALAEALDIAEALLSGSAGGPAFHQCGIVRFSRPVGFPRQDFEAGPIEDRDPATLRPDETFAFEDLRRHGDARAAYPQHLSQQVMGEDHFVPIDTVVTHQKPARQTDLDRIDRVGICRFRRVYEQSLDTSQ